VVQATGVAQGANPEWNTELSFRVPERPCPLTVRVSVMSAQPGLAQELGVGSMEVQEKMLKDGIGQESKFRIQLSSEFHPAQNSDAKKKSGHAVAHAHTAFPSSGAVSSSSDTSDPEFEVVLLFVCMYVCNMYAQHKNFLCSALVAVARDV
jgi:hypothetical protein